MEYIVQHICPYRAQPCLDLISSSLVGTLVVRALAPSRGRVKELPPPHLIAFSSLLCFNGAICDSLLRWWKTKCMLLIIFEEYDLHVTKVGTTRKWNQC